MSKHVFIIILLTFIFLKSYSQNKIDRNIAKIESLFNQQKFEDCVYKGQLLAASEKYKTSSELYYFITSGFFFISKDEYLKEVYPNALKDAFKYMEKLINLEPKQELIPDIALLKHNLKKAILALVKEQLERNKFNTTANNLYRIVKINPNEHIVKLNAGIVYILAKNNAKGNLLIQEAITLLNTELKNETIIVDSLMTEATNLIAKQYITYLDEKYISIQHQINKGQLKDNTPMLESLKNELILYKDSSAKFSTFVHQLGY